MLKNTLNKKNQPILDETTASQMLANIFDACAVEPNSVPLSVLTSYSNYRRARYRLQRVLLIIIITAFCLIPLLFLTPKLHVEQSVSGSTKGKPSYTLNVDTVIPISRITAAINGISVPVYETGDNIYTLEPAQNGKLTITATLKNHQFSTVTYDVNGVDTKPPVLLSDKYQDGQIFLYLSDSDSGVDYESIYALDLNHNTLEPDSYDETKNYVAFTYPSDSLNVYIPDKTGNTLQLILTVKE